MRMIAQSPYLPLVCQYTVTTTQCPLHGTAWESSHNRDITVEKALPLEAISDNSSILSRIKEDNIRNW